MAVLRSLIEVLARIDPGLWYVLDLRSRSAVSWIPAALLLAAFAFGIMECLMAGNVEVGAVLFSIALTLVAVKLRAAMLG
jgi:hypothetical protein